MPNPFLDPLHRQAPYASELLDFWIAMIKHDKAYASRLERHYDEIRAEIGRAEEEWEGSRLSSHDGRRVPSARSPSGNGGPENGIWLVLASGNEAFPLAAEHAGIAIRRLGQK